MKIEQRTNGSYRVRKTYKGKTYTVSFNYKPSQKEALTAITDLMNSEEEASAKGTFLDCFNEYIANRNNILSVTTVRCYTGIVRNLSDNFKQIRISDITKEDVQQEINRYSVKKDGTMKAPKTVLNAFGCITAIIYSKRPNMDLNVTLPENRTHEDHMPTDEEIVKILDYFDGTKYHLALELAMLGLRRSEICALTQEDLIDGSLHIRNAMVENVNNEYIIKPYPKNSTSIRQIPLPDDVIKEYKAAAGERIFNGFPGSIYHELSKAQKRLGIDHFRLHTLRAYFVSYCHGNNIPDIYIQAWGGWKTDYVMKRVYRRLKSDTQIEMEKKIVDKMSKLF